MNLDNPETESLSGQAKTQEELNREMESFVDFDCYFMAVFDKVDKKVMSTDRLDGVMVQMYHREYETEKVVNIINRMIKLYRL